LAPLNREYAAAVNPAAAKLLLPIVMVEFYINCL
jgi:hypothetical protein